MKTNYIIILLACLQQLLAAQTIKIYKTDNTALDYNLSDLDSITFSASSAGNLVTASNWICFQNSSVQLHIEPAAGVYEKIEEGLKVYGASGNNTVQLMPALQSSIMPSAVYLKWKVNSSGYPVNVGVELYEDSANLTTAGKALSLSTSSGLVNNNTWYYTRISIAEGNIISVTSKDNYDINGGEIISSTSLAIDKKFKTISFGTKTDKASYSILAELRIEE